MVGRMGERVPKVQICSYKKVSHGDVMCNMVTIVSNTIWHIGKLLKCTF